MTLAFDFERLNSVTSQPQKSLIQSKPNIKQFSRTIYKVPRYYFQLSWIKITPKKHNPMMNFVSRTTTTHKVFVRYTFHTLHFHFSVKIGWLRKCICILSWCLHCAALKKSYIVNVLFNVSDRSTLQKAKRFITLPNVGKLCQMPK